MNITNAYIYPRTDTAANFTAANTPLGNASIGAAEFAFERDTNSVKIGIGNWTTVPYLPNRTEFTAVTANITTLQADVASRSLTNHTHNATTDITTGTVGTARLGSGTANSTTFLRGDQVWAVPPTTGGGSGTDRGFFFDVRDYGAAVGSANAASNTAAFQAAVDAAAVTPGGWGGGTVYIPACENEDDAMWDLRTPVWVHGLGMRIMGEGSKSTFLRPRGPAFVLAKHPRYWSVWKTTYTDIDNSNATVNTTTTASGTQFGKEWVTLSRYKPDLYQFRTGGTWPPANGNPEFAPATISGTGQYFGVRTRKGVAQGFYPYCPLATGDDVQSGNSASTWNMHNKVTWEFVIYHHETPQCGGIAGAGFVATPGAGPDPWMLYGAGTDYYFELALTDSEGIDRTWYRFTCPQNNTVGIHRICIQFDPDNATDADRLIMWVDGSRKTVTRSNIQWFYGGLYHPLNSSVNGADNTGNLWTKWNRIAKWQDSHFTVGAESVKTGHYASDQAPYLTDYTVLAVGVHADALYTNATTQTKIGGGAADDSTVWALTSGNNSSTKSPIGWVANAFDWSPNDDSNLSNNLKAWGRSWSDIWGSLVPKGDWSNWGGYEASQNNTLEGFSIRQQSGFNVSCGLLLGPFLNQFELRDLNPAMFGFSASIGSLWSYVSYYGRFSDLQLNRQMHLIHMTVDAENLDFGYCLNTAMRITGSEFRLRSFSYPGIDAFSEGVVTATHGGGIGAGITLRDGTVNSEAIHYAPQSAVLYMSKHYAHGNNRLVIDNVQFGDFGGPTIFLDDLNATDSRPTNVKITSSGLSPVSASVIVRGKDWHGEIETTPDMYMSEQIQYRDALSGTNFCDLKTIDHEGYGVPPCGGFIHNSHEVYPRNPPEGGVALWRANYPSNTTATVYEGSGTVPGWLPIEMVSSANPNALSGNILPSIRATCSLPWPSGGNPTTIAFSGFALSFARKTLATILTGATAPTRSHIAIRWGYHSAFHTATSTYTGTIFATSAIANSGLWASASAGSKATSSSIATTGANVDPWTILIKRPWYGAAYIGGSGIASTDSTDVAFVFKTNTRDPAHWVVTSSDTPSVSSGGLTLVRTQRSAGTWTTYAANQILDWFVGGSLSLGATWYFGLSKAAINVDDASGISEPGTGSYARVSVAMNSTNWGEWFDSGFYANKVAIEFPAATADWGTCTHWFISDALSGGNIIAAGALNRAVNVTNGSPKATFYPGAFQVQV